MSRIAVNPPFLAPATTTAVIIRAATLSHIPVPFYCCPVETTKGSPVLWLDEKWGKNYNSIAMTTNERNNNL